MEFILAYSNINLVAGASEQACSVIYSYIAGISEQAYSVFCVFLMFRNRRIVLSLFLVFLPTGL
jgi:hypothetical protein